MHDLIIEKPQSLSVGQKVGQRLVTALFWLLFLYLLRPLFSVFAWVVGAIRFREIMIVQEGIHDLVILLKWYFLSIFGMALLMEIWALYNLLRFRGRERRRTVNPVDRKAIAAFFGIDPQRLAIWHRSDSVRLRHDEAGNIITLDGPESVRAPLTEPMSAAS